MPPNPTPSLEKVIELAATKAATLGTRETSIPCLLVAIAAEGKSPAGKLLDTNGLKAQTLELVVLNNYGSAGQTDRTVVTRANLSRDAQDALERAGNLAEKHKHTATTPTHLLRQLLEYRDGQHVIKAAFIQANRAANNTGADQTPDRRLAALVEALDAALKTNVNGLPAGESATARSILDELTVDLTALAKENKLDPVIGRRKEIRRTIEILGRQTKNNPVLIGEAGVGKTAIAEALAIEIAAGRVPKGIKNKRVLRLEMSVVVAGAKFRGEFEERLQKLIGELKTADAFVFIDELHTVVGAGNAAGTLDAAQILKPALARGEITAIGATTLAEYRKYIESDAALERRFTAVLVDPPSLEDTIAILNGRCPSLQKHHEVTISSEAVVQAATLADRYITARFQPDKSIDVLDEAASALAIDSPGSELTKDHINAKVSQMTGINVQTLSGDESERLAKMEEKLQERVIGQRSAIQAVSRAVRRARAGLKEPGMPSGCFLFIGPTGVGKTEVAKALQEFLFGDERSLLRFDMSEYMERHSVARLIGAPPGYVGHEEGGRLTEQVRRKPNSVILFDEIEKAHPDVFNIFLQIMDDGRLTDGLGRTVDFSNTILDMTSNIAAVQIMDMLNAHGEGTTQEMLLAKVMPLVKAVFKPEFLNRLDEMVCFTQLSREQIGQILTLQLARLSKRLLAARQVTLSLAESAKELLLQYGFDQQFGARPMKRAITKHLADPLSEGIIKGSIADGSTITVQAVGDRLEVAAAAA